MTQIFSVKIQNGKERKMNKNGKIKAMSLSFNPTIQSLIFHTHMHINALEKGPINAMSPIFNPTAVVLYCSFSL